MKNDVKDEGSINIHKEVLMKEIESSKEELKTVKELIPVLKRTMEIQTEILSIDEEAMIIQIDGFVKLIPEFEYEKDEKFRELMLLKQVLLNEQHFLNKEAELTKIAGQVKKLEAQVEYYNLAIKSKEDQMKEVNEGDGNE